MKKPELLSPAGNMECLKAAIQGGCDAVYLGGYAFGARSFAGNFSNEEIEEAISYAHLYGVKVYVTVNTLVYESEVELFLHYIDFLYQNNVDAIIIQDLGMMDLIRQTFPDLEMHASTQMHIHNMEGVKFVEQMGLSRAVLARETDIETIRKIKQHANIELEIFVHGALCFSYSGQCLMSSMIGGRSGNRGTCSQCCRMPYTLYDQEKMLNKDSYVLSPKDLNTLEHLKPLMEIGVDSLKIEGRMKRPEYVYYVTKLYRRAIDAYANNQSFILSKQEEDTLKKLFHREFTKGYLFQEKDQNWLNPYRSNHIGIKVGEVVSYKNGIVTCKLSYPLHQNDGIRILGRFEDNGCILNKIYHDNKLTSQGNIGDFISFSLKGKFVPKDVLVLTSDQSELEMIQNEIKEKRRKIFIQGKIKCKIGECIQFQVADGKNQVTVMGEIPVMKAQKAPLSKQRIEEQLQKLGDTVYELQTLEMDIDDSIFVPIQELNQIRRKSVALLNQKRQYQIPYHKETYYREVPTFEEKRGYAIRIHEEKTYFDIRKKLFKQIYVEDKELYQKLKEDSRVVLLLPRVMDHFEHELGKVMVGELGSIAYYHAGYSDFSLNVTNSYTVAFLHAMGIERVTLSLELSEQQIETLVTAYQNRYHKTPNLEYFITSYPEVMISKLKLPSYYHTSNVLTMKDQNGHQFIIQEYKNYTKIYYCKEDTKLKVEDYFDHVNTICFTDLNEDYKQYLI